MGLELPHSLSLFAVKQWGAERGFRSDAGLLLQQGGFILGMVCACGFPSLGVGEFAVVLGGESGLVVGAAEVLLDHELFLLEDSLQVEEADGL